MRLASTRQTNKRRGAGVEFVEFSVVSMVAMMLIFGVVEYGRALYVKNLMDNAAREGARYAVCHTHDLTTTDIQNHVKKFLVGQDMVLSTTISVYRANPSTGANTGAWTSAGFGEAICVQINGTYSPLLPRVFFRSGPVTFTAKSVMYSEAN